MSSSCATISMLSDSNMSFSLNEVRRTEYGSFKAAERSPGMPACKASADSCCRGSCFLTTPP